MKQNNTHTWDLFLHYYRCPKCGLILENRENYQYILGKYQKKLECSRCHHHFTVIKNVQPKFGPFFGEPQPIEWDWEK